MELTYENLYELARKERDRDELQEIPENLVPHFRDFKNRKDELSQVSIGAGMKEYNKTENALKLLQDLFSRRMRKIVALALTNERCGITETPINLCREEIILYRDLCADFGKHRFRLGEL